MESEKLTNRYYAEWLGVPWAQMTTKGIVVQHSYERDKVQKGYSQAFDLFVWATDDLIIVSYGSKLAESINELAAKIEVGMNADQISFVIAQKYGVTPTQGIKFVFNKQLPYEQKACKLKRADYPLYHSFFLAVHPNCKKADWLQEYFYYMVDRELCFGISADGMLTSVNDLPNMPYLADSVQEIGINTLSTYRGKGHAKAVCAACITEMLSRNICPQWSVSYENTESERLAYNLGFRKLSDTITLCL